MGSAVYIDGRIVPPDRATVPVFDRGFLFGDSVYETLRTHAGRPFLERRHFERLRRSAEGIALDLPWSDAALSEALHRTVAAAGGDHGADLYLRLIVTRGVGPIGLDVSLSEGPSLVVIALPYRPLPREAREDGVAVVLSSVRRTSPDALAPWLKTGNYLNNVMALRDAHGRDAFEALMLNARGELAEGTTSNVFLAAGDVVRTPSLACGILPGVTRAVVLDEARAAGIPCEETVLVPDDLRAADEVFITSTLKDVVPVTRVDGRPVGSGRPGPVTRRILSLFQEFVRRWTESGAS